jgi:transposase
MKYTQNKKIEQVNESTLIIGADIAKQKHIARAQDFRGIEFGRALTFDNSRDGFIKLLNWIKNLKEEQDKQQVIFGIEPTGQYWLPLAQFLRQHVWEPALLIQV